MRVSPGPYSHVISSSIDFPTYGLDIETDTTVNGLDPEVAAIVAVAITGDGFEHVIDSGGDLSAGADPAAEASIIRRTDALLQSLPAGVIITWNGTRFDLPFIARRAELLGIRIGLHEPSGRAQWADHVHLDGYLLYRNDVGDSMKLSCGLKPLARFVGLPVIEVDRNRIHELTIEECRAYVASDAHLAQALVHRRWPTALLALGPTDISRLAKAG